MGLVGGLVFVALSVVLCLLIYYKPQQLNAPAWVAYSAAAAFLVAGLLMCASALNATRTQAWLGVALLGSMVLVTIWVAFGSGERQCTISLLGLELVSTDLFCRTALGVGAIIVVGILALFIRYAIGRQRGG
jgi:hypothetical protein